MKKPNSIVLIVNPNNRPVMRVAERLVRNSKKYKIKLSLLPHNVMSTQDTGDDDQHKQGGGKNNNTQITSFHNKEFVREDLLPETDLVMVLGGDGSMIRACRHLGPLGIPLIGVNHGRLGFLTDLSDKEIDLHLEAIAQGKYYLEKRRMLEAKIVSYKGEKPPKRSLARKTGEFSVRAVNDIYLNKVETITVLEVNIFVDEDFMLCMRADGLIVATPTGSTAYGLSSGGPIIHPHARGLMLIGVAPHSLTNRPIVLPEESTITFKLPKDASGWLYADGQQRLLVDSNKAIVIGLAQETFTLAHLSGYNYYNNLREKLYWHEMPSKS